MLVLKAASDSLFRISFRDYGTVDEKIKFGLPRTHLSALVGSGRFHLYIPLICIILDHAFKIKF